MRRAGSAYAPRKRKLRGAGREAGCVSAAHTENRKVERRPGALCSQIATAIRTIKRMQSGVNFIELSGQQSFVRCATMKCGGSGGGGGGGDGIHNEEAGTENSIDIPVALKCLSPATCRI